MSNMKPLGQANKPASNNKVETKEEKQARAEALLKAETEASSHSFERRVRGDEEVWHDLIRLEVASPRRNISFHEDAAKNPIWETIPHKHFYHTVDSDGKPQAYATPANGHTHKVEIVGKDESGKPIVKVGPAIVIVKKEVFNLNTTKLDQHTHEASYIHSEKFKKRTYSQDFLVAQSKVEADMVKASKAPAGVK